MDESDQKTSKPTDLDVDTLKKQLEEAEAKAAEHWDSFLRARAENDNIRKRSAVDLENAHKYSIEKFARELLGVIDSLDQALMTESTSSLDAMVQGIKLTHDLFLKVLEKFEVKSINPEGEPFDPAKHEALSTQDQAGMAPNQVVLVAQKGFTLQDRVLRPARVIVSKKPALEKIESDPN